MHPNTLYTERLAQADEQAIYGVEAGHGGPFGACLDVLTPDGRLIPISQDHNRVLETNRPSAHAEDRALRRSALKRLEDALTEHPGSCVLMTSSAESCPACRTKQEITARNLIHQGLIKPRDFIVVYGATYIDTRDIAGFSDDDYRDDIAKAEQDRSISLHQCTLDQTPSEIRDIFENESMAMAAITTPDHQLLGKGSCDQDSHILYRAEINAIHDACLTLNSFDLNDAILWTSTQQIGPLAYTAAQWANISKIICLSSDAANPCSQESVDIDNKTLFQIIAKPYNDPSSVLKIVHIKDFANKAQKLWRSKIDQGLITQDQIYNGIGTDQAGGTDETGQRSRNQT